MIKRQAVQYRRGQRPTWLDEPESQAPTEAAVEEEASVVVEDDRRQPVSKGARSRIQVRVVEAYVEGERKPEPSRKAPVIETDGLEVPEAAVEVDEDDVEERRRRARLKLAQAEVEVAVPAADIPDLEEIVEVEEEEEEEEETEEEESEDDGDYDYGRVLMKPVFVSKANRNTATDRVNIVDSKEIDKNDEIRADERKQEIEQRLIDAIQREETERELAAKAAKIGIPDDTDLPDDPVEYEKWRLREMVRILRDREARRLAEEERAETERRRLLSDETIMKEHQEKEAAAPPKAKIKFLQRYHHKGVFYTDSIDQDLLQRDHLVATGVDAEVDRSLLPKVLQVKNFGLASRTKYTHLTDQDTSRDDPWAEEKSFARPTGFSSKRAEEASRDRDPKRPRTT